MPDSLKSIADLYDWRQIYGGTADSYRQYVAADIDLLKRHIDLSSSKVCDIGCGRGTHLQILVQAGAPFPTGIDVSGRTLLEPLATKQSRKIILVLGDAHAWNARSCFDAVICSLPPLSPRGQQSLRSFVRTSSNLLRCSGVLLLKLFTKESTSEILGNYAVKKGSGDAALHSVIEVSKSGSSMKIHQSTNLKEHGQQTEIVDLPCREYVHQTLGDADFRLESDGNQFGVRMAGTDTYIARLKC